MLKILVSFVVGVYTGMYLDQNYQVPKVTDPAGLYKAATDFLENYKRDPGKSDK